MNVHRVKSAKFKPDDLNSRTLCWCRHGANVSYVLSVRDISLDGTFMLYARAPSASVMPAHGGEEEIVIWAEPLDQATVDKIEIPSPAVQKAGFDFLIREVLQLSVVRAGQP